LGPKKSDGLMELYIHYEGTNRRCDEWVTSDKTRQWEVTSRKTDATDPILEHDEHEGYDEKVIAMHEESTKFKTIKYIELGKYRCETWYFSPFPEYYQNIDTLYICEFCLTFFKYKPELIRHEKKCTILHPMGNEIYRDNEISVFEIDGSRNIAYCENLCYISKLFLDHKNLSYDVEPFLFYVLTEADQYGCHIAGYFSKEKESQMTNNLSCILVLPFMQRKGFGKFLIKFSYELSKIEQKVGTPERPLSDLGYASYFSWWTGEIISMLESHHGQTLSIKDITQKTYIKETDVMEILDKLNILRYCQGNHILYSNHEYLNEIKKTIVGKPGRSFFLDKLHWRPLKIIN
jgi:GNAT superfamily N-acetyltransferase